MKQVWVKVIPWQKKLVTTAIEGGADAILVEKGKTEAVHALGRIKTIAPDGDLKIDKDVIFCRNKKQGRRRKGFKTYQNSYSGSYSQGLEDYSFRKSGCPNK
ncbi:MAG: 3-dehydroquinate synthase [Candidatus Methanoperedenaceae archaeon GB50]|nr:MAG: 3-dehydroquinate synthase [Candidatus Methanoperedenaceae archaeon GB50]